jgi:hypothetical protein
MWWATPSPGRVQRNQDGLLQHRQHMVLPKVPVLMEFEGRTRRDRARPNSLLGLMGLRSFVLRMECFAPPPVVLGPANPGRGGGGLSWRM